MNLMRRFGLAFALVLALAGTAAAQTNRFDKTFHFQIDEAAKLDAKVGPVKIDNVKVTNMGRGFGRGGFGPKGMQPSEGSTTLRFAFDVNNPDEEWELTFTLELLDKAGKVVDRVTKKGSWKEEAKIWNLDHPILEYVLPFIADVKLSVSGRVD